MGEQLNLRSLLPLIKAEVVSAMPRDCSGFLVPKWAENWECSSIFEFFLATEIHTKPTAHEDQRQSHNNQNASTSIPFAFIHLSLNQRQCLHLYKLILPSIIQVIHISKHVG